MLQVQEIRQKLVLDRPATCQIKVPGHVDESWSDWAGGGMTITTLTGTVDQAAWHGLLCRLVTPGHEQL